MEHKSVAKICFCTIIVGAMAYLFMQGWIIIQFPWHKAPINMPETISLHKKNIRLFFWHNNAWNHEDTEIIWSSDPAHNITALMKQWLALMQEDGMMHKKIMLQSVLMSNADQAYISLSRSPFSKAQYTREKLLWIAGFLKTIRENGIPITAVWFLVNHQPLHDDHLDFSNAWPITGF